ncbi:hypothetical protein RHGRI_006496 [Rhododendron griersonianum]|uniref:Uncharacterized protein n=1 Tax=Rhododendron griersonianum TaxID=479676 RepID=A0AAV6KT78_9ERIC|nr:hypothetical protein RHGRI_006496 [Rhododendron griersonianum]
MAATAGQGLEVAVAAAVMVVMAASGRRWGGGQRWMLMGGYVEGRMGRSPGQQQGLVPRVSGDGVAAARPFTGDRDGLRGAMAAWCFDLLWRLWAAAMREAAARRCWPVAALVCLLGGGRRLRGWFRVWFRAFGMAYVVTVVYGPFFSGFGLDLVLDFIVVNGLQVFYGPSCYIFTCIDPLSVLN